MALFSLEHVTKTFTDGHRVRALLQDVTLEVDAGDFVGIWGERRSGKSTLLRIAGGIESPDEGRVYFDGVDLTELSGDERAKLMRAGGIGLVSSDWRPINSQTAIDYIKYALLADDLSVKQARPIARGSLERTGALRCAHTLTDRLSISEAMRVGLAHALAREPRVLFVDEPAAVPSPMERRELYELIWSLGKDPGLAVVIASEDMGAISKARRLMRIDNGSVHSSDKEGEIVPFPAGRVVGGQSG